MQKSKGNSELKIKGFMAFSVKVNRYTFRGYNSAILIFASLLNRGQLFKERSCSHRSYLAFRVDLGLEGLYLPGKQTRKSKKLSPFVKMVEKTWSCTKTP